MKLTLVPARSRLTLETHAKGLLSKLAHDLSISAKQLSGSGESVDGKVSFDVEVLVVGLEVEGVLRSGKVDTGVLSPSDRRDIERKIRDEVLPHRAVTVRVASPVAWPPEGRVALDVTVALGDRRTSVKASAEVRGDGEGHAFRGRVPLSMPALGIKPVKGPLNAFRVDDLVDVVFDLAVEA